MPERTQPRDFNRPAVIEMPRHRTPDDCHSTGLVRSVLCDGDSKQSTLWCPMMSMMQLHKPLRFFQRDRDHAKPLSACMLFAHAAPPSDCVPKISSQSLLVTYRLVLMPPDCGEPERS